MSNQIKQVVFSIVFIAFGLIFSFLFLEKSSFHFVYFIAGEKETVGVVEDIERTNVSVGGSSGSRGSRGSSNQEGEVVYKYTFEYKVKGKTIQNVSYGTLREAGENIQVGEKVPVVYATKKPEVSKIENLNTSATGTMGLLVLLFPFFGVLALIRSLRGYSRND